MDLLAGAGARSIKEIPFAPLFIEDLWPGLYTNRSALHDPSGLYERRYMGGRPGSLIGGQNVEITVRNTIGRRFGLTPFSIGTYPTQPIRAFSFEDVTGLIRVLIDTGTTGLLTVTSAANASGITTVYTGVFPAGAVNAYAGMYFQIQGFTTNASNNGVFLCTASTATTLTLQNPQGIAETNPAQAISSGAVYYDPQIGVPLLLKGKQPNAQQSYFVAVAGICYVGDGVETWTYVPYNVNGTVWNWGIQPPTSAPSVNVVQSGSASVLWTASTVWSTMGLIYDSASGTILQLHSVNASNANTTQFGSTGPGVPTGGWNTSFNGTTTDGSVTWQNNGIITSWSANTRFASVFAAYNNLPEVIYDPVTKAIYVNVSTATVGGYTGYYTGSQVPNFKAGNGQTTVDNQCLWQYVGTPGVLPTWAASTTYPTFLVSRGNPPVGNYQAATVTEPLSLLFGLPTSQPVYWQVVKVGGTSGSSGVAPFGSTVVLAGSIIGDNGDTLWLSLGSGTWAATTGYSGWTAPGSIFSALKDSNGNFQVCTTTGVSGGTQPTWGSTYGATTTDGTVVWTCVGTSMGWTSNTKWYLPSTGFYPPQTSGTSSASYGGASIIDSNGDIEFIINSGLGGASHPTWNSVGGYTADSGTALVLTQVTVGATTATYTGTITGGAANGLVGKTFLIGGFTNAGNNALINVTASTGSTLVCSLTSQVNETNPGTAHQNAIWYNLEVKPAQSLGWTKGYSYAYSYKSRNLLDFYSVPSGSPLAIPTPPGQSSPLPAPTGSLLGAVSTASPAFTVTGGNAGAVNTVSGLGSTDPQVDTIVIWRSADGGGSSNMFELTEIPAPQPVNGVARPWSFQDFLPDLPTSVFPGLNELISAPIDEVNNPPLATFLPMEYNFERIWGATGQQVLFSGGPDTLVGNPQAAFNPADEFPFLSNVLRIVKTTQGSVVYTANSLEIILGGPATASFFSVTLAPGIGLGNYNALDVYMGEQFFMDATGQLQVVSPTLSVTAAGFPIADQLMKFNPKTAYITFADLPNDTGIYIGTGSTTYNGATGWFRMAPRQIPGGINGPEPVWSPFAAITNGCQLLQAVETTPGIKKLLVGPALAGEEILKRDPTVYTDDGTPFDANFQLGSLWLVRRGELAILKFLESDFSMNTNPTVSYLLNEISGTFNSFVTSQALFDPPVLYGKIKAPTSYVPLRFYFSSTGSLALAVHMQVGFDFGTTANADECFNFTIYGAISKGH
jgi:hypothetical protein